MNDHYERWGKGWAERHKDERKAYRAEWYKNNKLRISEQQKIYRFKKLVEDVTGEPYEQDV
jgi:hypothetical protein|tara:strand:+ start:499 stop:681 length:183 start_codon:yes stop_codon:yes gene_type:complete